LSGAGPVTSISTYVSSKELFTNLTLRELRSKYKRSFLGWTWSLANPLAIMTVYTVVFKYFLKATPRPGEPSGLDVYALFLLCALLPWNFFQAGVMGSLGSLTGNASLIKKSYFPRELLPAATVGSNIVSHMIEMGLLLVALLAFGNWRAAVYLPYVLLLTVMTALFAFGLGLAFSAINVYFRDVEHFMGILFLCWLYLTPIIYPFSVIPHKYATFVKLNPMTDMSLSYRAALYDGTHPGWFEMGYYGLWAVGSLIAGLIVFSRLESGLAEEL
jgi:lipopolysaccharide transport system permease protein